MSKKRMKSDEDKLQLSTAISDFALSFVAASAARSLYNMTKPAIVRFGAYGFAAMALAAGMGTLRFAKIGGTLVKRAHGHLSDVAGCLTFALVGFTCFYMTRELPQVEQRGNMVVYALLGTLVVTKTYAPSATEPQVMISVLCGVIAMGYTGATLMMGDELSKRVVGNLMVAGTMCIIMSIVIGTEGRVMGYQRVDVFHYVLAMGLFCVWRAITLYHDN